MSLQNLKDILSIVATPEILSTLNAMYHEETVVPPRAVIEPKDTDIDVEAKVIDDTPE